MLHGRQNMMCFGALSRHCVKALRRHGDGYGPHSSAHLHRPWRPLQSPGSLGTGSFSSSSWRDAAGEAGQMWQREERRAEQRGGKPEEEPLCPCCLWPGRTGATDARTPAASACRGGLRDREGRRSSSPQGMRLTLRGAWTSWEMPPSQHPPPRERNARVPPCVLGAEKAGQPGGPLTPKTMRQYVDTVGSCWFGTICYGGNRKCMCKSSCPSPLLSDTDLASMMEPRRPRAWDGAQARVQEGAPQRGTRLAHIDLRVGSLSRAAPRNLTHAAQSLFRAAPWKSPKSIQITHIAF